MTEVTPIVVPEFGFVVHGRHREPTISWADDLGNQIMQAVGGEPWIMLDDDWKRTMPSERFTICDDQVFMYQGIRRYIFRGPLVGSTETPTHDGFRVQRGVPE